MMAACCWGLMAASCRACSGAICLSSIWSSICCCRLNCMPGGGAPPPIPWESPCCCCCCEECCPDICCPCIVPESCPCGGPMDPCSPPCICCCRSRRWSCCRRSWSCWGVAPLPIGRAPEAPPLPPPPPPRRLETSGEKDWSSPWPLSKRILASKPSCPRRGLRFGSSFCRFCRFFSHAAFLSVSDGCSPEVAGGGASGLSSSSHPRQWRVSARNFTRLGMGLQRLRELSARVAARCSNMPATCRRVMNRRRFARTPSCTSPSIGVSPSEAGG
mmetsp:Transcript_7133/g.20133  ORF Transcript_7133/g.20133 Transcript_7133/m.20133 type:complete len:273 (+) Transcript_7133:2109-2927(+)